MATTNTELASTRQIQLLYSDADIFTAGPDAVLIHACNTRGVWGSGIALALKQRYPRQFAVYERYCRDHDPSSLLGTCLLIGPSNALSARVTSTHWIACLFTNKDIGRDLQTQTRLQRQILGDTKSAMSNLLEHVVHARQSGMALADLHMPQINSGSFRIPWPLTVEALGSFAAPYSHDSWQIHVHRYANP